MQTIMIAPLSTSPLHLALLCHSSLNSPSPHQNWNPPDHYMTPTHGSTQLARSGILVTSHTLPKSHTPMTHCPTYLDNTLGYSHGRYLYILIYCCFIGKNTLWFPWSVPQEALGLLFDPGEIGFDVGEVLISSLCSALDVSDTMVDKTHDELVLAFAIEDGST
jgi:hypothetical protein